MSKPKNPVNRIAVKYRLYPTEEQKTMLTKTFGCVRKVYNLMLEDKIKAYKKDKTNLYVQPSQYKEVYSYLKKVDSLALANAWINLNSAYQNFFNSVKEKRKGKSGFPKFKNKHQKQTYTTNNQNGTVRIENKKIVTAQNRMG
jgi:putative transposase